MRNINKSLIILFLVSIIVIPNHTLAKRAAIIIDYETKKVLFEKNADTLNYPASLTKMMTLYIVFDYLKKNKLNWNTKMRVSRRAASQQPSKLYLEEGSTIIVEDAVMALIIKSANDVATVVAEHISNSEENFASLMNKYARNIGMKKTTFKNASGLPNKRQMTTARDISILSYSLIKNFPKEYKLFKTEKFVWKGKTYKTHNKLMKSYPGADGIKTGYIRASGYQLAFSAIRENKRLIGIYFGGDSSKHRNNTMAFYMNKEFSELNILPQSKTKTNNQNNIEGKYQVVVGTFKYKRNAEKHLKLIKKKYPKTTSNKDALVVLIKSNGKQLYESRFRYFSKKDANIACKRLKKYRRDCFVRG
ncbi:MAG: D-alanyl-D-alanine carboxypeptidase DacF [Alphaproteobacteria bacterium MarineAlpha5_Bin6]|nr:MAG: D-alanyl-D-alanine carboxypeptidase DacF [Alphaproteobacteria bacterium MarineAlpha5_Bin6]|tara:strand:- start:74 stop:1159 length:1086 start_codon:yes stop_codon:yes gene_type:complete